MSFDDLNRYSATHKVWDHVGNIIPDIEHSEGERPAFEFQPASWLPVQFYDKHYENWMVVLPGKAVALDPDGCVMPAEYGLTGASVVYTANDVTAGVIDIATGLAVTTAKTVVLSQLNGTRGSAWSAAVAGTTGVNNTSGFMGRYGVAFGDATVKYPIGVAPYAYLQWAGDSSNPANYTRHNYNMQHLVAVLCDYVIRLPLIPAQVATETVEPAVAAAALVFGTRDTHTKAQAIANTTGRYNATTGTVPVLAAYPVIALALDEQDVATNTSRTTITMTSSSTADDLTGILVSEKTALSAVTQAGDFFVDYPVGVVFIYSADSATIPAAISGAAGTVQITYYRNGTAPGVLSRFACVLAANIQPGDFLVTSTGSNLTIATTEDFKTIVGQVIGFETHPRDALDRVRTAYNPALGTDASGSMANGVAATASLNLGQMDQMPGSATGGYPDLLHYAGGADTIVIINLVSR
jgi:hypothetical protein